MSGHIVQPARKPRGRVSADPPMRVRHRSTDRLRSSFETVLTIPSLASAVFSGVHQRRVTGDVTQTYVRPTGAPAARLSLRHGETSGACVVLGVCLVKEVVLGPHQPTSVTLWLVVIRLHLDPAYSSSSSSAVNLTSRTAIQAELLASTASRPPYSDIITTATWAEEQQQEATSTPSSLERRIKAGEACSRMVKLSPSPCSPRSEASCTATTKVSSDKCRS